MNSQPVFLIVLIVTSMKFFQLSEIVILSKKGRKPNDLNDTKGREPTNLNGTKGRKPNNLNDTTL